MSRHIPSFLLMATLGVLPAFSAGLPNTTKILVYAERPLSPADISGRGAVIRTYPAFTVLRVPTAELQSIQETAREKHARIEVMDTWDTVSFTYAKIDTRTAPERRPRGTAPRLYLVQFAAPITADDERILRSGGLTYVSYVPYNAALVLARPASAGRLARLAHVQWVSAFEREHKAPLPGVPVALASYVVQFVNAPEVQARLDAFRATHDVQHEVSYLNYTNYRVELDPQEVATLRDDPLVVTVEPAGVSAVSGERDAISVARQAFFGSGPNVYQAFYNRWWWAPFRPNPAYSYKTWVTSWVSNIGAHRIAVADTGLRRGGCGGASLHPDLPNGNIIWGTDWVAQGNCNDDHDGHGTMVAAMAAADPSGAPSDVGTYNGTNYGTFNYAMGVAPGASLFIQRVVNALGSDISNWVAEARALPQNSAVMTISHNEYGSQFAATTAGLYNATAQLYDTVVRDTSMPITVSAGNICDGPSPFAKDCTSRVLSPATAKNVITLGASESFRPAETCDAGHDIQAEWRLAESFDNVAWLSRRGTEDNRIKPELIAPGTMVSSAHAIGLVSRFCKHIGAGDPANRQYDIASGTSFSAPQAAGAISLINAKYGSFGAAGGRFSPAMLKAILVGTAKSVRGGRDRYGYPGFPGSYVVNARPNEVQGFGRLYLADLVEGTAAFRFLDENAFTPFTPPPPQPGRDQTRSGTFTVANWQKPVVIVLAWTDEPAVIHASPTLVRDLDLTVDNGCIRYSGNYMDDNELSFEQNWCNGAQIYTDKKNNLEMVYLPWGAGPNLTWTVTLKTWGTTAPNVSPRLTQPFALFAYNVY